MRLTRVPDCAGLCATLATATGAGAGPAGGLRVIITEACELPAALVTVRVKTTFVDAVIVVGTRKLAVGPVAPERVICGPAVCVHLKVMLDPVVPVLFRVTV